jgi:hypothetical protein
LSANRDPTSADDLDLAEHLWHTEGSPWDPESPWQYLVFLAGVEESDVDIESCNELTGYQDNYIPQGFSRGSDARIHEIKDSYESIETVINELTGSGVQVHEFDEEPLQEESEEEQELDLGDRIVAASRNGDQYEELGKTGRQGSLSVKVWSAMDRRRR